MPKIKEKKTTSKSVSAKKSFSLISDQKLTKLYTTMVQCRLLEQHAASLFAQGKLTAYLHASADREAAAAAVAINLLETDALSPAKGDFVPAFVKGMPLDEMFKQLQRRPDCNENADHSQYQKFNILSSGSTLRDQLKSVYEVALSFKANKKGSIAVAFLEDQASSNVVGNALESAAGGTLPILFVSHGHAKRQTTKSISGAKTAAPDSSLNGVPAIMVDSSDAVAIYRVVTEAMTRARQGRGPTLLECVQVPSFVRSVDASGAERIYKEMDHLAVQYPISKMESYLQRKGLFSKNLKRRIVARFNAELELATRCLND
jgi:pyruvate dehydrogenase E1 component alpha subunit